MFGGLLLGQFPLVDENVEDGDETTADARWGEKPAVAEHCCTRRRLEEGRGLLFPKAALFNYGKDGAIQ